MNPKRAYDFSLWRLLLLFVAVPTITSIITEVFKTRLIWYFRAVDFVDLVFIAPFYLIVLMLFNNYLIEDGAPKIIRNAYLFFGALLLYGHAMHVTANAVNTFSTEIRDYQAIIPTDTYALLYFLDETLSHILLFLGIYGVICCLFFFEVRYAVTHVRSGLIRPIILGFIFGVGQGIAFVEADKVVLAPFLLLTSGYLWFQLWQQQQKPFIQFLHTGSFSPFVAAMLLSTAVTLIFYLAIVGAFIQPSQFLE